MESAARQAGLRAVVTSRLFLERARLELPPGPAPLWVEELRGGIGRPARPASLLLTAVAPARLLERLLIGGRRRTWTAP